MSFAENAAWNKKVTEQRLEILGALEDVRALRQRLHDADLPIQVAKCAGLIESLESNYNWLCDSYRPTR